MRCNNKLFFSGSAKAKDVKNQRRERERDLFDQFFFFHRLLLLLLLSNTTTSSIQASIIIPLARRLS